MVTTTTSTSNYSSIDSAQLLGSILNDMVNQCDTGASGIAYICVVQTGAHVSNSGLTTYQQQAHLVP